jgi:signal transduction histidine kinase
LALSGHSTAVRSPQRGRCLVADRARPPHWQCWESLHGFMLRHGTADSSRMTVRRKLAASVAALLLLSAASTVLSVRARQRTATALADLQQGQARLQRLLAIDRELHLRHRELSVLRELTPTPDQVTTVRARLRALDEDVATLDGGPEGATFLNRYRALADAWAETVDGLARHLDSPGVTSPGLALDSLLAWRTAQQAASVADAARFSEVLASADRVTMALLACSLLIGVTIAVALSVSLSAGFSRLDLASRHVAAGEYGFRLPVDGDDEFARAAMTFNDMAAALAVSIADTQAARARAEEASATKSSFLTSLCHDLKTPLTAILGYADLIEADVQQARLMAPASDIRQLRRSARVLLGMVGELLDFARLEVGRMPVALDAMDPARLVEEVADTLRPLFEQRRNAFSLDDRRKAPFTTDQAKLRHILLNLLGNACKFTSDGRVEVVLRADETALGLVLEVRDTGIGMTAEEAARIFAPYVQANSEIVQRYGGSGLGLAISRQFAQLLGGGLQVRSAPGAGTTFTLTLPGHATAVDSAIDTAELDEAVALFAALDAPGDSRLSA